jgi:type IX secretion system PorP/SprF family membrane protein
MCWTDKRKKGMMTMIKSAKAIKKPVHGLHACFLTAILIIISTCCKAQLNPYQAIYFQDRYLANPAMAGLDKGLNLNLAYQQQWSSFPGAPKQQSLTTEYQATDKVGLGLIVNDEQSGLFRQTRIMGSYAYHLPLGAENQKLNFGLSLGVNDSRINYDAVNGDLTDPELLQYNQKGPYFDGDLGLSYTSNNLFIEGVLPNLNTVIFNRGGQRVDVDRTVFFTAISYKIKFSSASDAFSLEPLAAYREVKGFSNIFDLGLNFKMTDYHLDLQTIYHSNDNIGFGFVLDQRTYAINFDYNVYSGQITNYTNGAFEIGIKLKLFK